jgi:Ala-tRNA(Pro) deacylase
MPDSTFDRLKDILDKAGVVFKVVEHGPTLTSEESALARNEPLEVGAKALLLKADAEFVSVVLPANRKLDSAAVKRNLQVKNLRFATPEELFELTGLKPGSLPPFRRSSFSILFVRRYPSWPKLWQGGF